MLKRQNKKACFDKFEQDTICLSNASYRNISQIFSDKSYNFNAVKKLDLISGNIQNAGAKALADSPNLKNLTELNLTSNYIGSSGAEALADSPNLKNLVSLNLKNNQIGAAGAEAIANSVHLKNLTKLYVADNRMGPIGEKALVDSPNLKDLIVLKLEYKRRLREININNLFFESKEFHKFIDVG